eukprot:COSAG06_NODE_10975_length_1588_cov_1.841504_3_plen_82_part_00
MVSTAIQSFKNVFLPRGAPLCVLSCLVQYEEVCGPIGADFYCGDHDPAYLAKPHAGMQFPDYPSMWANGQVVNAIKRVRRL